MAAQELLLLLALFSNTHAEDMKTERMSHHFHLDDTSDFCSVSKWTGEGKQLLWNSSASFYKLQPLAVSHSGQYQQQCWTRGKVTLERNSTLLICGTREMAHHVAAELDVGETVELSCDEVGPNQSVQWAYIDRSEGLVSIDAGTPPGHKLQRLENKRSLLVTADKRADFLTYYHCLEKQQLRCHVHSQFAVVVAPEYILRSVGESLELNCSDGSGIQTHRWRMFNSLMSESKSLNSTLMFPSLTLNHTGEYTCDLGDAGEERYSLYVCPEPEPPAVQLFTVGENLTLHCGDWDGVLWFMTSNRTQGQISYVSQYHRPDNVYLSGSSLVLRNVSLQDSGQVWCVVMRGHRNCVFRSETLVMFGEPGVDHHLLRSVLLSAAVLVMLCVVGVVEGVVWRRSRRKVPLPPAVEEQEMSQLSPESEVQEEAPV